LLFCNSIVVVQFLDRVELIHLCYWCYSITSCNL